ncbi:MAG: hypothetical protein AAB606_01670 [Patescibacteria group bacterium]
MSSQKDNKGNLNNAIAAIALAYEARIKIVNAIVEDTHNLLKHFKERREKMANELREVLAQCKSLRKKDFDRMMADILQHQHQREEEVKRMLESFHKGEEMIVEKLKKFLAKGGEISIRDVRKTLHDIQHMQEENVKEHTQPIEGKMTEMQKEVHAMLLNFKQERQSIAGAWEEAINLFSTHGKGKE